MAFTCACMHGTSSTLYIQCKMPTPLDSEATAICNMHIGGFAEVAPPEKWHGCLGIEGKVTPASCMNTSVYIIYAYMLFSSFNSMHARNLEAILFPSITNWRPTPFGLSGFLKLVPRAGAPQDRQSGAISDMHPAWSFNIPKHATLSACMCGMPKNMHACICVLPWGCDKNPADSRKSCASPFEDSP